MAEQPEQEEARLGPLLRLEGIDYDRLPSHHCSIGNIRPLLTSLLKESLNFIASVDTYDKYHGTKSNPSGWYPKGSTKYSGVANIGGPGEVVVELLERNIPKSELKAAIAPPVDAKSVAIRRSTNPVSETWVCRRSFHDDESAGGTANWREFLRYMKEEHVETEEDMTPTVVAAQKTQAWPAAPLVNLVNLQNFEAGLDAWTDFTLHIVEMRHDLKQFGFDHRVFPVLQMTCRSVTEEAPHAQFLVISVPINGWKAIPAPDPDTASKKVADARKTTIGSYVSVERFRIVRKDRSRASPPKKVSTIDKVTSSLRIKRRASRPSVAPPARAPPVVEAPAAAAPAAGEPQAADAAEAAHREINEDHLSDNIQDFQIEWTMATASHARGWIPLMIQKPFIPKKIAIDVPLFLKEMVTKRKKEAAEAAEAAARAAQEQLVGVQVAGEQPLAGQPVANQPIGNPQAEA